MVATYILRRLLVSLPVVLGVVTVVFFSLHLAPGDPVEMLIPADAVGGAAERLAEQLRAKYGFDQPLHVQYIRYLGRLARLDFGVSVRTGRSVAGDLLSRYPATFELAVTSLALAAMIGIPFGVISALHRNRFLDKASMALALVGVSTPNFWLGLVLMYLFALKLGWLPPSGRIGGLWTWEAWKHLLLPAVTLGVSATGILARLARSSMLDVLREDYIRTARAKGLSGRVVIYRHALKNALIPVVTVLGLQLGGLLSGAVIAETVFAWPGVGRYMVQGILGKDFPVVQGGVLLIALSFVIINLIVDLLYLLLDPRITYA